MLDQDKIRLFFFSFIIFLFSCGTDTVSTTMKLKKASIAAIGSDQYNNIFNLAKDSIDSWVVNELDYYKYYGKFKFYYLDSLLCFNESKDRFVSCILTSSKDINNSSDGIEFFYGEKHSNSWYFYSTGFIVIPRWIIKDHPKDKPPSYQQLHEIALKEVYSGYLNTIGKINEDWFKSHFESIGKCADCKTSEDFKKNFLEGSKALWANRDTTKSPPAGETDSVRVP